MASSDSQINEPQRGRPKRAELPDVNINIGAQIINSKSSFRICYFFDKVYREIHRDISKEGMPLWLHFIE